MNQLKKVDRKTLDAAVALVVAEHLTEIYDSVDSEVVIVVWLLQGDHSEVDVVVIAAVVHTIAESSKLEGFHDLCDIPMKNQPQL